MGTLWQDVRYGLRMLVKSPRLSIVATIALALGIGANTAIFSVVNAVLLRPLPFPNSDALMSVFETDSVRGGVRGSYSYPNFFDLRDQNHVFEHVAAYHDNDFTLTGQGQPVMLHGAMASADLFSVLGVTPRLGRTPTAAEDKLTESGRVVVLSERLFAGRFNSDPNIINKTITLNGHSFTIIGVMPKGFEFPIQNDPLDLWTTIADDAAGKEPITAQRGAHFLRLIGRLKTGVTQAQAQAEVDTIGARLSQQYPDTNTNKGIRIEPTLKALVGDVRPALLVLLGAVACVLLIACANVANLLLARALAREREIAVRTALGASRQRLVQQLLFETMVIALAGGAAGLGIAKLGIMLVVKVLGQQLPQSTDISLNATVLGFTLGLSILTGILAGLMPAWKLSKSNVNETLKQGGRSGDTGGNRTRAVLVVCEVALSLMLLAGAGLMIRSLWNLRGASPGFDSSNVLTMAVPMAENRYKTSAENINFWNQVLERVRTLPGVESAGTADDLPLQGGSHQPVAIEGRPVVPMAEQPEVDVRVISTGYLKAMRIPVIRGRDFNENDIAGRQDVILISEAMAKQFWPGENPIGQRLTLTFFPGRVREIVGVVSNVKLDGLDQTAPNA